MSNSKPSKSSFLTLQELERQGQYVFHGSGKRLEQLEPRQAFTTVDDQSVEDGVPAIHASELVDYAIFMALIDVNWKAGCRASCSYDNEKLLFGANALCLSLITESTVGFVHVFHKSKFEHRIGIEWRCYSVIEPIAIVEVVLDDFKHQITIMPESSS